jgi:hypothetical protein
VALQGGLGIYLLGLLFRLSVKERELLAKNINRKIRSPAPSIALRDKATRQLFEGAKPTLERLALISDRVFDELNGQAVRENWVPLQDAIVLRRRLSVLSDSVLALMEEPDEEALLTKTRLDAITSLLKAIDRLKAAISDLDDHLGNEMELAHDEIEATTAFAAIDQRIEDLAQAYAKKLVESQSEPGAT